jgi:hypothetical protein
MVEDDDDDEDEDGPRLESESTFRNLKVGKLMCTRLMRVI